MATYSPQSVGVTAPTGGFKEGGWYNGRQYWGGTLSEPGQIHPSSTQVGAGQLVSAEVNAQSAQQQGITAQEMEAYLAKQRQQQAKTVPSTTGSAGMPAGTSGMPGTTGAGAGVGIQSQPSLNLPDLYKTLYESSGITAIEKELSDKQAAYDEAVAKIRDNPYLSEATMVGRLKKLSDKFEADARSVSSQIATKKADIETQLSLQTKQFDINSQSAQQALNQFNVLLQMGALNNASGEDIAAITRSTGLSSQAIQSAVEANKQKDVKTQVITSTNDAGVVTASVINTQTGEVISKTNLGAIGNAQNSTPKATETDSSQAVSAIISSYAGNEAQQAMISPEDLYTQLLLKYPLASKFIKENWTPDDIRAITR